MEEQPSSRGQALWVPTVPDTRQSLTGRAPFPGYPQAQGLALRYLTDWLSNLKLRRDRQNQTKGCVVPRGTHAQGLPLHVRGLCSPNDY